MRVSTLVAAAMAAVTAHADFHVIGQQLIVEDYSPDGGGVMEFDKLIACPSNKFNCDCFKHVNAGSMAPDTGEEMGIQFPNKPFPSNNYFQLVPVDSSNFCGAGTLNLYGQGDGSWQFYQNGGDGTLLGTCARQPSGNVEYCAGTPQHVEAYDLLVCSTYFCN